MVAAGAANTAGKGGPILDMSRGVVPLDTGNSTTWAWEVANDGVGEPWPQVQIDAYFTATIVMNERFGNRPDDLFTHALGVGDGWTDRKIDPARADAVQGLWRPRAVANGAGTWLMADIRAEIMRRADTGTPEPPEPEPEDDEVTDDDIERIAQRAAQLVWRTRIETPSGEQDASTLLEWIKRDTADIKAAL
jgi:hypothetical protein